MEVIRSWWEVPCVAHFCHIFMKPFKLPSFEIEELEDALLLDCSPTPSKLIVDLLCTFLNGIVDSDITEDNCPLLLKLHLQWRCDHLKEKWNPLLNKEYKDLDTYSRVCIIHKLCHWRLELDDIADLLRGIVGPSLRLEPVGRDMDGNTYWHFYGTRLYKEETKRKKRRKKDDNKEAIMTPVAKRGRGGGASSGRGRGGGASSGRGRGMRPKTTTPASRKGRTKHVIADSVTPTGHLGGRPVRSTRRSLENGKEEVEDELEMEELENSEEKDELMMIQGGNESTPPTEGSGSIPPTEGSGSIPPTEGSESAPPTEGSESAPPTEGSESAPPTEGSGSTPPTEGSGSAPPTERSGYAPPTGGSGYAPPTEGSGSTPPTEGSGYAPPTDGSGSIPPTEGSGSAPPTGGSGYAPPTDGSGSAPPTGGSGTTPPTGGSGYAPPTDGSGSAPPTGWSVACSTLEDWNKLIESFHGSKHTETRKLIRSLEALMPDLEYIFSVREKQLKKRLLSEMPRRSSDRIAIRTALKEEDDKLQAIEREMEREELRSLLAEEERVKEEEADKKRQKRLEEALQRRKVREEQQEKLRMEEEDNWEKAMSGELSGRRKAAIGAAENVSEVQRLAEEDFMISDDKEFDLYTAMHKILGGLRKHEEYWVFEDPVTEAIAPGYFEVVDIPMDYVTVEKKLEEHAYMSKEDFIADVELIYNNCREYNGEDSEYSELSGKSTTEDLPDGKNKKGHSRQSRSPSACKTPELTSESSSEEDSDDGSDASYVDGGRSITRKTKSKGLMLKLPSSFDHQLVPPGNMGGLHPRGFHPNFHPPPPPPHGSPQLYQHYMQQYMAQARMPHPPPPGPDIYHHGPPYPPPSRHPPPYPGYPDPHGSPMPPFHEHRSSVYPSTHRHTDNMMMPRPMYPPPPNHFPSHPSHPAHPHHVAYRQQMMYEMQFRGMGMRPGMWPRTGGMEQLRGVRPSLSDAKSVDSQVLSSQHRENETKNDTSSGNELGRESVAEREEGFQSEKKEEEEEERGEKLVKDGPKTEEVAGEGQPLCNEDGDSEVIKAKDKDVMKDTDGVRKSPPSGQLSGTAEGNPTPEQVEKYRYYQHMMALYHQRREAVARGYPPSPHHPHLPQPSHLPQSPQSPTPPHHHHPPPHPDEVAYYAQQHHHYGGGPPSGVPRHFPPAGVRMDPRQIEAAQQQYWMEMEARRRQYMAMKQAQQHLHNRKQQQPNREGGSKERAAETGQEGIEEEVPDYQESLRRYAMGLGEQDKDGIPYHSPSSSTHLDVAKSHVHSQPGQHNHLDNKNSNVGGKRHNNPSSLPYPPHPGYPPLPYPMPSYHHHHHRQSTAEENMMRNGIGYPPPHGYTYPPYQMPPYIPPPPSHTNISKQDDAQVWQKPSAEDNASPPAKKLCPDTQS